jgi:hypothetical protein
MDAKSCWLVSIALHGAVLLWAGVMAIEFVVLGDGDGPGFSCSVRDPAPRFERIERPKDLFAARIPITEESAGPRVDVPVGSFVDDRERWSDCCECYCGGAASALTAWRRDLVSYFDRKLSVASSRRGVPRLKTHSPRCAFQESGIDADCTCGLIPRRY